MEGQTFLYNAIINYGYIALFIGLMIEGTGTPGPVEILFFAAAYLVSKGEMNLFYVIVIAAAGNVAGNIIAYLVGYYKGRPFVEKYGKYLKITVKDLEAMDKWFAKYGGFTVLLGRLVGLPRTPAIWASGITRMNFTVYVIFSAIADFIWSTFWAVVSYLAAMQLIKIDFFAKNQPPWVYFVSTVGFMIFLYFVWRVVLWMKERYLT
ncbi:SNARE associated protein [Thermoanaerobacter kivui]|uniref:SNARE associated protein n=1 Tax=Thermoanaerobacter kivui TaxID=2325 RepID=A0A097ANP8_THEKI|nr:DedA family protein [Thermoanaerobacter kivui]AIS51432.1 SNARE associated protein [Thermoanaerobacter kivui]